MDCNIYFLSAVKWVLWCGHLYFLSILNCSEKDVQTEEDLDIPEDAQPSAEEEGQLQKSIGEVELSRTFLFLYDSKSNWFYLSAHLHQSLKSDYSLNSAVPPALFSVRVLFLCLKNQADCVRSVQTSVLSALAPADIQSRSRAVFSDVQDDFCDVKKILSRFEEWRGSYSESYHSAYISLCLPKLLNPIIRHQLLSWNPLKVLEHVNTQKNRCLLQYTQPSLRTVWSMLCLFVSQDVGEDFENVPWFTAVETFCHGHGHVELEHTDRQTLSNIIEKTVLSKITGNMCSLSNKHRMLCSVTFPRLVTR